jgi:hypothetical protein
MLLLALAGLALRSIWLKLPGALLAAAGLSVFCVSLGIQMLLKTKAGLIQSRRMGGLYLIPVCLLVVGMAWMYREESTGSFLYLTGSATLLAIVGTLKAVRWVQSRRVAKVMREAQSEVAVAQPDSPPAVEQRPDLLPLRLDVYLHSELPVLNSYVSEVTPEHNIVGRRAERLLYLYNFFQPGIVEACKEGQWRRFGPVYFLGSPQVVAAFPALAMNVAALLLRSCEAFDERFAQLQETPLPPGDSDLKGWIVGGIRG